MLPEYQIILTLKTEVMVAENSVLPSQVFIFIFKQKGYYKL